MSKTYLLIENPGVVGTELLTIVGASAARGNESLIGQFGSGFKFSIALLLRKGVEFRVYLGNDGFEFETDSRATKDAAGRRVSVNEVVMKQISGSGRKSKPLGFDMGFGAIDWTDVGMAVREFVSNAIDGCVIQGIDTKNAKVTWVEEEEIRAKKDVTRIYIEGTSAVQAYYNELAKHFLMFNRDWEPSEPIMPKRIDGTPARVYRKGVLVGEFGSRSLFDYNLNEIHLNEARIISESDSREVIGRAIRNAPVSILVEYLRNLRPGGDLNAYEMELDSYYMKIRSYDTDGVEVSQRWLQAWKEVFGEQAVCCEESRFVDAVEMKGHTAVVVSSELHETLASMGVKTAIDVLDHFEALGRVKVDLTAKHLEKCQRVWKCLERLGLTRGRAMPVLEGYADVMDAGRVVGGYYDHRRDTVGLSRDTLESTGYLFIKVVLEEFSHAITKSGDCTRDLQDFSFRVSGMLMEESFNG
jgi:hypothetical protein